VVIPDWNISGELPPGVHWAEWSAIVARLAWTARRQRLLIGLEQGLLALAQAGCHTAYLDGSFVSQKASPGDFDVCWEVEGVSASLLDPVLLTFSNRRAAQKAKYGGEFFPAEAAATPGGLRYLEFFQISKFDGRAKGIIAIDIGRWI
jgi:hypothetical protein